MSLHYPPWPSSLPCRSTRAPRQFWLKLSSAPGSTAPLGLEQVAHRHPAGQSLFAAHPGALPDLTLNGWVDDIGFDGSHNDADILAANVVTAWHELRDQLKAAGLRVNNNKTAFIVTDKTTQLALAKRLAPDDPPIQTVMRDLGIDHSAGRRRRIATLKQRFNKNKQRRIKLRSLKLPNLKNRLRLHRGGVQPVAMWGFEGQGLAPRYRQGLWQHTSGYIKVGSRM